MIVIAGLVAAGLLLVLAAVGLCRMATAADRRWEQLAEPLERLETPDTRP